MPIVRVVEVDQPWAWLAAGWRDFARVPGLSLLYGILFSATGCALTYWLYASGMVFLILPAMAGFALIGPATAVGLYDVSRRLDRGQPVSITATIKAVL